MADLDFLADYPRGNATIIVCFPDGSVSRIGGVCPRTIGEGCPLLMCAFDDGPYGGCQASIEATSVELVASFLRYLYLGTYLSPADLEGRCSLLRHVELFKMAEDYDVPQLQVAAQLGFTRDTEYACCVPNQPVGLCEATRFIYKHSVCKDTFADTLLNYCVSSFAYHGLGSDDNFRQVAFELPEFHRGLCQTSFQRDFKDEGASEIVRLPVCRPNPISHALFDNDLLTDKRTHAEFQFEEWYDEKYGMVSEQNAETGPERHKVKRRRTVNEGDFTLVHRAKDHVSSEVLPTNGLSSDEDGFMLVHRPKDIETSADHGSPASDEIDSDNSDDFFEVDMDAFPMPPHNEVDGMNSSEWTFL